MAWPDPAAGNSANAAKAVEAPAGAVGEPVPVSTATLGPAPTLVPHLPTAATAAGVTVRRRVGDSDVDSGGGGVSGGGAVGH